MTLKNQNKSKSKTKRSGRGTQKHSQGQSPSKVIKTNPEEETPGENEESKLNEKTSAQKKAQEMEMMCVLCLTNRKTVVIQTCKHLVFCRSCERDYALKYPNNTKCPICRKEYKKTFNIQFA